MKILLAAATLTMIVLPAAANAAQCRDSGTGKFAKCDAPGAVPASQYVAKTKTKTKTKASTKSMHKMAAMPTPMATATTTAKPGMMSMMKAKPAATTAARCKTAKGKFIKCGMPGAMPA